MKQDHYCGVCSQIKHMHNEFPCGNCFMLLVDEQIPVGFLSIKFTWSAFFCKHILDMRSNTFITKVAFSKEKRLYIFSDEPAENGIF